MKLYTYLPKENTALTEGLLSTSLSDKGFEKYRGRTGKHTKEDVLKVLDSWEPEWTRSKAISALTEPIPEDAAEDFLEFARNRRLYSFDTKDLIKAKILAHIRRARKGGGTDPVDEAKKEHPNWHRKKKHLLFQGVPHYFVETTGGKIPPEFVTEEKQAEMSRDRIQAQYARHPQSSLDILAARLARRKWGPEDVAREYDAHSREYDATKEDKEFLDRYIIARIGEKYDRKAKIKQALMRRLWEKEHNGKSFDAALPYRMARFRQYEEIPFPTEKKAADRNFLSVFKDLANMPQTASNPTDDDIRAAFKVDPAKVRGHDTVPHFIASVENVNPEMGRMLWGLAKGRVLPRVSMFSESTPNDLRSTADVMVETKKSWPNGANTVYAALTNMYDRVARKTGKPVWDVANARPTEYGKIGNGFSLNVK